MLGMVGLVDRLRRRCLSKGGVALHAYLLQDAADSADHCQSCHRPGEVAPPLVTYEHAPWAGPIANAVEMRMMPPWFADPRYGHFSNDVL
jgi:hypothetical protein